MTGITRIMESNTQDDNFKIYKAALHLACEMLMEQDICDCKPCNEPIEAYLNRVTPDYCQDNCLKNKDCIRIYFLTKAFAKVTKAKAKQKGE